MELLLEARPSAARTGRRWVMDALRRPGRLPVRDAELVELLAGELLADAVVHGPQAGRIRVRATHHGSSVRVAVRDEGAGLPQVTHPGPTAPGARGVGLVDALVTRWGVEDDGPDGTTVWFVLDQDGGR